MLNPLICSGDMLADRLKMHTIHRKPKTCSLHSKTFYFVSVIFAVTYCTRMCQSLTACTRCSEVFKIEPKDATTKEGETVVFTCSVGNFTKNTGTIIWDLNPTETCNCNVVLELDRKKDTMTSKLILQNVSRTDHYVTCKLNTTLSLTSNDHHWNCFLSRRAKLSVLFFPRRHEILCSLQSTQPVREGNLLSVKCEVPRCKPAVDVHWTFGVEDAISIPRSNSDDKGLTRISSLDLPVSREMHLRSITCMVTSEIYFPEKTLQCSVGPILVLYPPRVFVNPPRLLFINEHPTQLECLADGYPENYTFSWSCSITEILNGCDENSKSINLFINKHYRFPDSDIVYVIITCAVSNSVGTETSSSVVKVERGGQTEEQIERMNMTSTSCDNKPSNITINGQYIGQYTPEMTKFQCIFHGHGADFDDFQTQMINDKDIMSNLDFTLDKELPDVTFSLYLMNISQLNVDDIVVCEVAFCNSTQMTVANISWSHPVVEKDKISSQSSGIDNLSNSDLNTTTELHQNYDNSQSQPYWQIATIAIGSVLAMVILILCIATVKNALRNKYKLKHSPENRLEKNSRPLQKVDKQCDELSSPDPIYEVPAEIDPANGDTLLKSEIDRNSSNDFYQGAYHTYESRVHENPPTRLASESSYHGSTTTNMIHSYYAIERLQTTVDDDTSHKVIYDNDHVVQMHSDFKGFSKTKNAKLLMVEGDMYEVPLPQIPLKPREQAHFEPDQSDFTDNFSSLQ